DLRRTGMGPRLQHRRPADPDADEPGRRPLRPPLPGTPRLNKPAAPAACAPLAPVPPAGQGAGSTERAAPLPGATTSAATPAPLRAWRYLRLGLHLVYGVATVALVYPF